jgi:hypothetical protein
VRVVAFYSLCKCTLMFSKSSIETFMTLFIFLVSNMASNSDPLNPVPDWFTLDEEDLSSGDEEVQPMEGDDNIDPDVHMPPMRPDDDPFWDIQEESRDEIHNQEDRPVRYLAIDITEMVPPHVLDDCDPVNSGLSCQLYL